MNNLNTIILILVIIIILSLIYYYYFHNKTKYITNIKQQFKKVFLMKEYDNSNETEIYNSNTLSKLQDEVYKKMDQVAYMEDTLKTIGFTQKDMDSMRKGEDNIIPKTFRICFEGDFYIQNKDKKIDLGKGILYNDNSDPIGEPKYMFVSYTDKNFDKDKLKDIQDIKPNTDISIIAKPSKLSVYFVRK